LTTRTWRAKRRIGAAALVALIGSTLAFATPAGADSHEDDRLAGADRYETAAAIGEEIQCGGAATFVNGSNFPDGLVASQLNEEILLVERDSIPAATMAYIEECGLVYAYIVGGESVISSDVFEDLITLADAGGERIAGADRYATALAVANWYWGTGTGMCDVVLTTGENFPDALAAAPLAYNVNAPMLLTSGSALRADVKAYLGDMWQGGGGCALGVPTVHIIGGTSAVPASIETEINTMGIDTNRIAGANRYETAVAIAAVSGNDTCAVLINGSGFADALAAGPWASWYGCSLMLTNADSIPAATAAWHAANCESIDGEIYVAGGEAVVSDAVHLGAIAASTCTPVTFTAVANTLSSGKAIHAVYNVDDGNADMVRLTGIDGSGAGGFLGDDWAIVIVEGEVNAVTNLDYSLLVLEVTVDVDAEDGMTPAQFVEIWNGLSEANLLFEASVGTLGAADSWDTTDGFGVAPASTDDLENLGTQDPFVQQSVTVTFNQAVTKCGGGAVDIDDVDIDSGPGGYAITGDGTVFTITMNPALFAGTVLGPDNGDIEMDDDNGVCSAEFPSVENDGEEVDFS
jgi:putative cell wall-binding protein